MDGPRMDNAEDMEPQSLSGLSSFEMPLNASDLDFDDDDADEMMVSLVSSIHNKMSEWDIAIEVAQRLMSNDNKQKESEIKSAEKGRVFSIPGIDQITNNLEELTFGMRCHLGDLNASKGFGGIHGDESTDLVSGTVRRFNQCTLRSIMESPERTGHPQTEIAASIQNIIETMTEKWKCDEWTAKKKLAEFVCSDQSDLESKQETGSEITSCSIPESDPGFSCMLLQATDVFTNSNQSSQTTLPATSLVHIHKIQNINGERFAQITRPQKGWIPFNDSFEFPNIELC